MNLTPELLADLRKKAMAATPGPWLPRCDYQWDLKWLGNDKGHASVATKDATGLVDREICRFQVEGSGAGVYDQADLKQVAADIEHVAAANPAMILALLDRIEAAGDMAALRIHPDATVEGWEKMKSRIEALQDVLGEISTTCETKELRAGGDTLAPREVVDRVWQLARNAYTVK